MNSICVKGHLVGVPELNHIRNKAVCSFSLLGHEDSAIDKEIHFFKCEAAGKLAEAIAERGRDGMEIFVEGQFEAKNYTDEKKNRFYDNRIIVEGFIISELEHMTA